MAKNISAGDLKHNVVFKEPTSSLNDEGGQEVSHAAEITTRAAVFPISEHRITEANVTTLIGAKDFYVRYSVSRSAINKDWLLTYNGEDYTIHSIDNIDEEKEFIRFTAKTRSDG